MTCPKCKVTIEADSVFCRHCGTRVGPGAKTASPQDGVWSTSAPRLGTGPATAPAASSPAPASTSAAAPESLAPHAPPGSETYRDPAHEKEVWRGRPAWKASASIWALWLAGAIALTVLVYKYVDQGSRLRDFAWGVIAAAAVVIVVRHAMVVFSRQYRLTTQRLFIHRGILSRTTDQTELVRVEDVRLKQGLVDRILNTGNVEVIGSDRTDENVVLESIDVPAEVAENIRRTVRAVRTKGTLFIENV